MKSWLPFLTGFVGAVVGAVASLGGIFLNMRSERQKRTEEATRVEQSARRQDVMTATKEAYAFLYQLRRCLFTRDASKLKSVDNRWGPAATALVTLRVGSPRREIAQLTVKVVTALDQAVNVVESWLKRVPIDDPADRMEVRFYSESDAWGFYGDAVTAVDELVARARVVEGLEEEIPPDSSRLSRPEAEAH